MQASGARGSIGKASYEAVRKHIDAGKKATEAFKLVAQETGRSTATVQTAYYRVARSLPGGGGVQLRPRRNCRQACRGQDCHYGEGPGAARPAAQERGRRNADDRCRHRAPVERCCGGPGRAHLPAEKELVDARKDRDRLAAIERALGRR